MIISNSPLSQPIVKPKTTWVRPEVLAEVQLRGVTDRGVLRDAVFKDERAVVVTRRELNHCSTRGEIFCGVQEPKAEMWKDPDWRDDPSECRLHPDCRHTSIMLRRSPSA